MNLALLLFPYIHFILIAILTPYSESLTFWILFSCAIYHLFLCSIPYLCSHSYFSSLFFSSFHYLSTQSGGDTYFCIDTLLRDKAQDFAILTPLGTYSVCCCIIVRAIYLTSFISCDLTELFVSYSLSLSLSFDTFIQTHRHFSSL